MFLEVCARISSLAAWAECCYGARPIQHLVKKSILSCCGVQGDPLAPLGFTLTLQPIVEKIKAAASGLKTMVLSAVPPATWRLPSGSLKRMVPHVVSTSIELSHSSMSLLILLSRPTHCHRIFQSPWGASPS